MLGPVRALGVAWLVARHGGPVLGVDWGRRRLLRQSLALAGLALLRRIPGGTHAPRTAGSAPPRLGPGEGELWEGFVLLPEGVLYTLIAEHDPRREATIALIASLQPM